MRRTPVSVRGDVRVAALSGLDTREECGLRRHVTYDDSYRDSHRRELSRHFPRGTECNAHYDLVPNWLYPTIVVVAVLVLLCPAAAAWCARKLLIRGRQGRVRRARLRNPRPLRPSERFEAPGITEDPMVRRSAKATSDRHPLPAGGASPWRRSGRRAGARLAPALGAIAKRVPELSSLLKVLKSDLERTRGRAPGISEDTAWMVYEASRNLAHLQHNAPLLMDVGDDLAHLQDNVSLLASAAQALMRVAALSAALSRAADGIKSAAASLSDARRY